MAEGTVASPADACKQALLDATLNWPKRKRTHDGIMGDEAHQKRKSDHNQGNAFDLTHDPANGVDCNVLSKLVIDDPRVTYVIWNEQIYNREKKYWRKYIGTNPHKAHMHVSIKAEERNNVGPWPWSQDFAGWLRSRDRQMPPAEMPRFRALKK
jgi:hypothetical protein